MTARRSSSTPRCRRRSTAFPGPATSALAHAAGGDRAPSSARARRWSSPTRARRRRSGTRRCWTRVPTGRARSRCTTARSSARCATGSRTGCARAVCAAVVVHVEPRPRRRLHAGGPGAADRQPEGRGAPAAARRTQRPSARAQRQPRDLRADACARAGRSRRGARRPRPRAAHRGARADARPARRAGPASGDAARWAAASGRDEHAGARCAARTRTAALTDGRLATGRSISSTRGGDAPQRLSRVPARGRSAPTASPACAIAGIARRHRMSASAPSSATRRSPCGIKQRRDAWATSRRASSRGCKPGDCFVFAGRRARIRPACASMTAWVQPARKHGGARSRAGRAAGCALSSELADATRALHRRARRGAANSRRRRCRRCGRCSQLQARWSALPARRRMADRSESQTREGHALFFYPFEGRLVHLGLAALLCLSPCARARRPRSAWPSTTTASSCCRRRR